MEKVQIITQSVLCSQILLNLLSHIKTEPYCQRELKKAVNFALPHLIKSEQNHYDKFFDAHEKSTDEVYMVFANFIAEISKVPIYDMDNLLTMYDLYKNHKKETESAMNKIIFNANKQQGIVDNKIPHRESEQQSA